MLEIGDGVFEVKATAGDNHLGGDNFDKAVVDWLVAEFKKAEGLTCRRTRWPCSASTRRPRRRGRALLGPGDADQPAVHHRCDSVPKHLNQRLTRSKLNELTADLLDRRQPDQAGDGGRGR